jgi:hypothetical protein
MKRWEASWFAFMSVEHFEVQIDLGAGGLTISEQHSYLKPLLCSRGYILVKFCK